MIDHQLQQEPAGIRRYVPIATWLPRYERAWLPGDVLAGLTVWALVVPESLAYAGIAGVPVQYGLYAVILAAAGYAAFGSSRLLFVGPSSTVAALSAVVVAPLAVGAPQAMVALSAALAVLVGVVYVVAGLARLGFVANFFAKPVLDGFICGLGVYIVVGQVPKLVGIEAPGGTTVTEAVRVLGDLPDWDTLTVAVGASCLAVLFLLRLVAPKVPGALVVAAAAIAAVSVFGLDDRGLATVGSVPTGFSPIGWSTVSGHDLVAMVPGALGIVIVGFAQSVAIAKAYDARDHRRTDPDQEMIGYGVANIGAGALGGFAVTGSLAKSAAAEAAGGRTPVVSLIAAAATLLTVVALAGLFESLPEAALAAIVIQAVWGMVDPAPFRRLWRAHVVDFWLAVGALAGVILVGILPGIVIGVVLSLLLFQHRVDRPHSAVLGRRPDGETYGDIVEHHDYLVEPGVVVFRWDAPLIFANADHFGDELRACVDGAGRVHAVVLDFESVFDVDTTGTAILEDVDETLGASGATLYLAHVHGPVRDLLRRDGTWDLVSSRVHDTVRGAVEAAGSDGKSST